MAIQINKVVNANVYINGASFLGQASEVDVPTVTQKMVDHVALGMIGTFQFPSGIEPMECRIGWNSFYPQALAVSANPGNIVQLQVRANVETYTATGRTNAPAVIFMTGQFKSLPGGNFRQHENVELESMLNVHYFKMQIDGADIVEFDAFANIYKVNGVDIAGEYRANIGQ